MYVGGIVMDYMIMKGYEIEDELRKSFNQLAEKTFGLQFEKWYQAGYWTKKYQPYSVAINRQVVANVSVNHMEFLTPIGMQHLIQVGTVMTAEEQRHRGWIRIIMEAIEKDYPDVQGYYLFANDQVLDFYPKFGYVKQKEYQFSYEEDIHTECRVQKVSLKTEMDFHIIEEKIIQSVAFSKMDMRNNKELYLFYLTQFMQDNVFRWEAEDAYFVAEIVDHTLILSAIFADHIIDPKAIMRAFGKPIRQMIAQFTPLETNGYIIQEMKKEDTTLFMKGNILKWFDNTKLAFPELSHA